MRRGIQSHRFLSAFIRMGFASVGAAALLFGAFALITDTCSAATQRWVLTGGPGGGTIYVLAVDPQDPTIVYAGTIDRGVYKSGNSGASWRAVNTGLTNANIRALAINPQDPMTVYAGTSYGGVFRSSNGGGLWSAVNTGLTNQDIVALAIDPQNPATVYAGTSGGVFKSTNGGSSWR